MVMSIELDKIIYPRPKNLKSKKCIFALLFDA